MRFGESLITGAQSAGGLYQVRVTPFQQPPGVGDGICRALAYYWLMLMLRPSALGVAAGPYGPTQAELLATLDTRWKNFNQFVYAETTLKDEHRHAPQLKTLFADGLSLEFDVVHVLQLAAGPGALLNGGNGLRDNVTAKHDRATGFVMSIRFPPPDGSFGHTMALYLDLNRAFFFEPNIGVFHFAQPGVLCHWLEHEYLPFFEREYGKLQAYRLVRVRPIKARRAA